MILHPRYPVWVTTQMCFNLISKMTIPGINFYLSPSLSINPRCSSQLNLDILLSFLTFDTRRAGMYTPNQMKNFWDNVIHNSASDTLLKKLPRTILTRGNSVRISEPGNLECFLSLNDRLLLDHLLTPSFFVDKFKETFGELGYIIQCLGNFFACFLLVKFVIDVVVIVLRGLENRKVSDATFGFVRTMLEATFHLFVLSLQTPMYENEENKRTPNGPPQNLAGNRPISAPIYEENSTLLYP